MLYVAGVIIVQNGFSIPRLVFTGSFLLRQSLTTLAPELDGTEPELKVFDSAVSIDSLDSTGDWQHEKDSLDEVPVSLDPLEIDGCAMKYL